MSETTPPGQAAKQRPSPTLRRLIVMTFWALLFGNCLASVQAQTDPMKVQRGAQGMPQAPVVQQQQQPFYVQAAVVVLLSGGAVWTVCRSSRRQ